MVVVQDCALAHHPVFRAHQWPDAIKAMFEVENAASRCVVWLLLVCCVV